MKQPVGMMDALGIARDLLANDAQRVAVVLGAAHAPDRVGIEQFDLERAGRGAVMRADRSADLDIRADVHEASLSQMIANVECHQAALRQIPCDKIEPRRNNVLAVREAFGSLKPEIVALFRDLWAEPELSGLEVKAMRQLSGFLERHGFSVHRGRGQHPHRLHRGNQNRQRTAHRLPRRI